MNEKLKNRTFGAYLMLAGLWAINLVIVFFGWPFLVLKKLQSRGRREMDFGVTQVPVKEVKRSIFAPCQW